MDEFEKREKLKAHWRNSRLLQKDRTLCGLRIEYMRSPEALKEEVITCQKCKRVLEAHKRKTEMPRVGSLWKLKNDKEDNGPRFRVIRANKGYIRLENVAQPAPIGGGGRWSYAQFYEHLTEAK